MAAPLRVGIVGASAGRGWARESHVPAVRRLPGLELAVVATQDQASADAAAAAFGTRGFGDARAMIRDPGVDLVAVAVKVPGHRDLVLAALAAGKHVYCEWPLGRDAAESEELRDAAARSGVRAAIGLQARGSAAVRRAAGLVAGGAIGRVLAARHYSDTVAFGPRVDAASLYLEDPANGATLVSIHGGHALDLAVAVLGGFAEVGGLAVTQYPEVEAGGDGGRRPRSIPDRLLAAIRLRDGAGLLLEVVGGRRADGAGLRLEVVGEKGRLALSGGAPRGFQSGRITLALDGEARAPDEGELAGLPDAAVNVAGIYAALRDDVAQGTATAPGFDHAARLSRLVEDTLASAATGTRRPAHGWPER